MLKGPTDAWKADKATYSAFGYTGLKRVVRELMEYDERVGDAPQYGRSWTPSSDDTRNRIERVFEGKISAVADNDTKPRWFEWNVYLEPGWPGQWVAQTGKTKLSILQIKRTSAFLSFCCTRGDANGAKGLATFNWADNGPVGGGVDLDPQTKTIPLSQIVGVWIQVRVEAEFAVNGWLKIYLRFGSGLGRGASTSDQGGRWGRHRPPDQPEHEVRFPTVWRLARLEQRLHRARRKETAEPAEGGTHDDEHPEHHQTRRRLHDPAAGRDRPGAAHGAPADGELAAGDGDGPLPQDGGAHAQCRSPGPKPQGAEVAGDPRAHVRQGPRAQQPGVAREDEALRPQHDAGVHEAQHAALRPLRP
jgi:hypothetical protein